MKVAYVHRKHFENAGDWWSTPHHYFQKGDVYDFIDDPMKYESKDCDLLIIGGGGILELEDLPKHQRWINRLNPKKKVIWGAGASKNTFGQHFYNQFDLIGLRNAISPYPFVPCVSCLHPLLKFQTHGNGEIIIGHNKRPLPNQNHNQHVSIETSIKNIINAKKVITTSYHIYYWSRLMGKNTELAINTTYPGWKPVAEKYFTFPKNIELEKFRKIQLQFSRLVYSL